MKRSRVFYFHPETNGGKIQLLEALQVEYHRYLQSCIDTLIERRRFSLARGEFLRFFPHEAFLSTNIVTCVQSHAVEIVSSWASSLYANKLKGAVKRLFRDSAITEAQKFALFTIGKHSIDRPWEFVTQEHLDLYWALLLDPKTGGKVPVPSARVGMRMSVHTSGIRVIDDRVLTIWWFGFSHLVKGRKVQVPILGNPHVKSKEDLVNGCLVRKDKRGRWRVEVLEKKAYVEPKLDPSMPRLGVDVGLNVLAATSDGRTFGASVKPKFYRLYDRVKQVRTNRQRQGFAENSRRLDVLEDKLSSMVKTETGRVANHLVKAYPGYAFVIEDLNLSGCRGQKRFAYRSLHSALARKAPVIEVNPAYSSQMCPSCGYINPNNRHGTKFHCRCCGKTSHADVVGGMNLLGRSEDQEVQSCENPSEVKAILRERFLRKRNSSPGSSIKRSSASNRRLTTRASFDRNTGIDSKELSV